MTSDEDYAQGYAAGFTDMGEIMAEAVTLADIDKLALLPKPRTTAKYRYERFLTTHLPYGRWTCADGREVLFNRQYRPLWSRRPGEMAVAAHRGEWVAGIVEEGHYYDDSCPVRTNQEVQTRCIKVLEEWGVL
jgi:hypothetical protein